MPNPPSNTPVPTQPVGSNPVSSPSVQAQPAVAEPRNSQGLTAAEMGRAAEAMSSRAKPTTPIAPTGTTQNSGAIQSTRTTPVPAQGIEAPSSRQETYVRPSMAPEVARLNNISLDEANARIQRAEASQQGRVAPPPPGAGFNSLNVSYDPATDTYQDRLTKNYYAGFDPKLGHIFLPDAKNAIKGIITAPTESGILTTDGARQGIKMLGDAITSAEGPRNALPFSTERSTADNLANNNSVGTMWESTLPPEMQLLLQSIQADQARLTSGTDEASLLLKDLRRSMADREASDIRSIQDKASSARADQEQANKVALGRAKVFFANIGALGGSQEMQYVADTISGGERALRDIGNAERDAIQQARNAYTDKDYELAFKQVDLAESRRKEYQQTLKETIELKQNFEQMSMQKLQFNRQMESSAIDMETKKLDLEGKKEESAMKKLSNLVAGGNNYANNPEVFNKIGAERGWTPEETRSYTDLAQNAIEMNQANSESERQAKAMESASKMLDFFDRTGTGGEIIVGGNTYQYQGQPKENVYEGTETDVGGFVYHWTVDKDTGEKKITEIGPYGKAQDGWSRVQTDQGFFNYNSKTDQYVSAIPGPAQASWQEAFPNGSQSPFRTSSDPNQGECGAFVNDLYGNKIIGNTYAEKAQTLSKYEVSRESMHVGDTFLMTSGTTGHIGIVASVSNTPNGVTFTALESNMVPPGGGVISSTRSMSLNDPKLKMIARVPTPNLPQAGSGAKPTMQEPTINGRPIKDVMGNTGATTLQPKDQYMTTRRMELGIPDYSYMPWVEAMVQANIENEYNSRQSVLDAVSKVSGKGKNADERAEIKKRLNSYYERGDFDGLETALKSEALQQLSATQQDSYNQFANGADAWGEAQRIIDNTGGDLSTGPYKSLAEAKKPYLTIKQDPQFADLFNIIELGQAQVRKGFYGTAVTDTEAATAKKFLISDTDTMPVIQQKLKNGLGYMQFVNDATLAQQLGLPRPKLEDYLN